MTPFSSSEARKDARAPCHNRLLEERAELLTIYHQKGLSGPLLQRVVAHLTQDPERWHRAMIQDELGVVEDRRISPWLQGLQVGVSFVVGGFVPTVPVLFSLPSTQLWAYGLTALMALTMGAVRARYTNKGPVRSGLEFLLVVRSALWLEWALVGSYMPDREAVAWE